MYVFEVTFKDKETCTVHIMASNILEAKGKLNCHMQQLYGERKYSFKRIA